MTNLVDSFVKCANSLPPKNWTISGGVSPIPFPGKSTSNSSLVGILICSRNYDIVWRLDSVNRMSVFLHNDWMGNVDGFVGAYSIAWSACKIDKLGASRRMLQRVWIFIRFLGHTRWNDVSCEVGISSQEMYGQESSERCRGYGSAPAYILTLLASDVSGAHIVLITKFQTERFYAQCMWCNHPNWRYLIQRDYLDCQVCAFRIGEDSLEPRFWDICCRVYCLPEANGQKSHALPATRDWGETQVFSTTGSICLGKSEKKGAR